MFKLIIDFFSSLKLAVVTLACCIILVFVGTLAQVDQGLYMAQTRYFRSFLVYWTIPGTHWQIPVMPGGYLLGFLLLTNLLVSQLRRIDLSRKNIGLLTVHAGLVVLLVGQLTTDMLSVESHMRLREGDVKNYSESGRESELAIVDTSNPGWDQVVSIPESRLRNGAEIQDPHLPFTIRVTQHYVNSNIQEAKDDAAPASPPATQGFGRRLQLQPLAPTVSMDERNLPSAVLELDTAKGSMGTWLAGLGITQPQEVAVDGRTFQIVMRAKRYYKPFSIQLEKFRHDQYKGTDVFRNFSSKIRLLRPDTSEDREVLIYMNNPLRYAGETFYQSGYDPNDPRVTILQVVRNPGWLTPYIACALVSIGLVIQFMSHLVSFATQRRAA